MAGASERVPGPVPVVNGRRLDMAKQRAILRENAALRRNLDTCWGCAEFDKCTMRKREGACGRR